MFYCSPAVYVSVWVREKQLKAPCEKWQHDRCITFGILTCALGLHAYPQENCSSVLSISRWSINSFSISSWYRLAHSCAIMCVISRRLKFLLSWAIHTAEVFPWWEGLKCGLIKFEHFINLTLLRKLSRDKRQCHWKFMTTHRDSICKRARALQRTKTLKVWGAFFDNT